MRSSNERVHSHGPQTCTLIAILVRGSYEKSDDLHPVARKPNNLCIGPSYVDGMLLLKCGDFSLSVPRCWVVPVMRWIHGEFSLLVFLTNIRCDHFGNPSECWYRHEWKPISSTPNSFGPLKRCSSKHRASGGAAIINQRLCRPVKTTCFGLLKWYPNRSTIMVSYIHYPIRWLVSSNLLVAVA